VADGVESIDLVCRRPPLLSPRRSWCVLGWTRSRWRRTAGVDALPAATRNGVDVLPATSSRGAEARCQPRAPWGEKRCAGATSTRSGRGATAERSAGIWWLAPPHELRLEQVASVGHDKSLCAPNLSAHWSMRGGQRGLDESVLCYALPLPFCAPSVLPRTRRCAGRRRRSSAAARPQPRPWPRVPSLPTCSTLARILYPTSPPSISSRTFPATCALSVGDSPGVPLNNWGNPT
jgi:hypothetical protein